jgi:ketosteroid isomerase-like protein
MNTASKLTRCSLVALALLCSAPIVHASAHASQTEAHNEDLVRRAFAAWSSGTGHVMDLFSPDIRWTIAGSGPSTGTFVGKEDLQIRAFAPLVDRLAAPLKPHVHHVWTSGDRVIVRFDASTTTTSGAPYSNQFVWILKLDQGRVVEGEAFLDMEAYRNVVDNNDPVAR